MSLIEATGAAIKACTTITKAVIDFATEIRHLDESLENIRTETRNLAGVLGPVRNVLERFRDISHDVDSRTNQEIVDAVDGSMADCNGSLKRLTNIFGEIRGAENGGQILPSAQQAYRLKSKSRELDGCRSQIRDHKQSLHLSLTMITLYDFSFLLQASSWLNSFLAAFARTFFYRIN